MSTHTGTPDTIDAYIAGFPSDVQAILQQVRMTIRKAAPNAQEGIRYRMPTFLLNGNLVHFAAFRNHIGFYPTPSGISAFTRELSPYESARGSVRFPIDRPMPLSLIARIVRFRVRETAARTPEKKRVRSRVSRTDG